MDAFQNFIAMCAAVGSDATDAQVTRLADYVRENFGCAGYGRAAEIALYSDVPNLYTELSMLCGESGVMA